MSEPKRPSGKKRRLGIFQTWTSRAIKVAMYSQIEAAKQGFAQVLPSHLFIAVFHEVEPCDIINRFFNDLDIDAFAVRVHVQKVLGPGSKGYTKGERTTAKLFHDSTIKIIKDANQISKVRDIERFCKPCWIMLSIFYADPCPLYQVYRRLGLDFARTRVIFESCVMRDQNRPPKPFTTLARAMSRTKYLDLIHRTEERVEQQERDGSKFLLPKLFENSLMPPRDQTDETISFIEEYTEDLTWLVSKGVIENVFGRDEQLKKIIQVLIRRTKNNPCIVGEPGVGKTAIAEGLASAIYYQRNVPVQLIGLTVIELNMGSILAGTKFRGDFEERLQGIMTEAINDGGFIIVLDEIHNIVGSGSPEGTMDAANLLKPILARNLVRILGITTITDYKNNIENDTALARRFSRIDVPEPSKEITYAILNYLRFSYQVHHRLDITDSALHAAVNLSIEYIQDRFLPDKAFDVLDEACSYVRLSFEDGYSKAFPKINECTNNIKNIRKKIVEFAEKDDYRSCVEQYSLLLEDTIRVQQITRSFRDSLTYLEDYYNLTVTEDDVFEVITARTGIPLKFVDKDERLRLLLMEEAIGRSLIGQKQAINSVCNAVRRARVGLKDSERPIASFIFAGPTGVGKTQLAKILTQFMFGSTDFYTRLDMSEYMEKYNVSRLIGAPPGYIGYQDGGELTEAVRRRPYNLILLDEVEKAHPDVFNIFLQLLDEGRLTDTQGRISKYNNCIVILTSNLGASISATNFDKANSDDNTDENTITKEETLGLEEGFGLIEDKTDDVNFLANFKTGGNLSLDQIREQYLHKDAYFGQKLEFKGKVISEEEKEIYRKKIHEAIKEFFRPELLNRLDEIVIFDYLTFEDIDGILSLMLSTVRKKLMAKMKVQLVIHPVVRIELLEKGYDIAYGARPMKRAVAKYIEDIIADGILMLKIYPYDQLSIWPWSVIKSKKQPLEDVPFFLAFAYRNNEKFVLIEDLEEFYLPGKWQPKEKDKD